MFNAIRFGSMVRKQAQLESSFLATAHTSSPFTTIYSRTGDSLTKLPNPTTLPTGNGRGCSMSPNGNYLVIAHEPSPYITIYKRTGDTFVKLPQPSNIPAGQGYGCAWSVDSKYLAITCATSPYMIVYSRNGDTFTKLTTPVTTPTGAGNGCSWSPDGNFLAVAHATLPYLTIYTKDSNDILTKLPDPGSLPDGTGNRCSFSPGGTYLAVAHATGPRLSIYVRDGSTFTKQTVPSTIPTSAGADVSWNAQGDLLAVAHYSSPYVSVYTFDDSVLTKISDPEVLPGAGAYSCWFTPDGYLAVGSSSAPYLTFYSRSGDVLEQLAGPDIQPAGNCRGITAVGGSTSLVVPPPPPPTGNSVIELWTFEVTNILKSESGNGTLNVSGNAPVRSTTQARVGTASMKSYLNRLTSPDMYRTEASHKIAMQVNNGVATQDYWFGFSLYIPSPYPSMTNWVYECVWQIHGTPIDGIWPPYIGMNPTHSLFLTTLTPTTGKFKFFQRYTNDTYPQTGNILAVNNETFSYVTDRWYDIVVNTRMDSVNGFTKLWIDGALVVNYVGGTYFRGHGPAYDKFGLYTGWRGDRVIAGEVVSERTLFHDQYRWGYGSGVTYDMIKPV